MLRTGLPLPTLSPAYAAWNTVGHFDDYEGVQRAVDWLSDDGFPVEKLDVVGSDVRLVERVTGRRTKARAAAKGAASGLWLGLLIGLLVGLFSSGNAFLAVVGVGAGFGLLWGAVFGFAAHASTRGQRDFSSLRTLTANRYQLIARDGTVDRARFLLTEAGLLPPQGAAAQDTAGVG
jgi:heat induced stress protein YflT